MGSPLSVRELLTRYLDLTSAPRRSDLKLLSHYATQTIDRRALQHLSSKDGKQDYKMKIMESKIGLVELLQLCPYVYVCGGVKMGHDVTETIKEIIGEQASTTMSPSDAAAYVTKLSTNGRYVQELWS